MKLRMLIGLVILLFANSIFPQAPDEKTKSVISYVVHEANGAGTGRRKDPYLFIAIGKKMFIVNRSGRIIKTSPSDMKSFSGDFANIYVDAGASTRGGRGEGGNWLLRRSGKTWRTIGVAEGDYSCDVLREVPAANRRQLDLMCWG